MQFTKILTLSLILLNGGLIYSLTDADALERLSDANDRATHHSTYLNPDFHQLLTAVRANDLHTAADLIARVSSSDEGDDTLNQTALIVVTGDGRLIPGVQQTPLLASAAYSGSAMVKLLLENGARVGLDEALANAVYRTNAADADETVRLLIAAGANVHQTYAGKNLLQHLIRDVARAARVGRLAEFHPRAEAIEAILRDHGLSE